MHTRLLLYYDAICMTGSMMAFPETWTEILSSIRDAFV